MLGVRISTYEFWGDAIQCIMGTEQVVCQTEREREREILRTSGSGVGGAVQRRESTSSIWEVMGTRVAE